MRCVQHKWHNTEIERHKIYNRQHFYELPIALNKKGLSVHIYAACKWMGNEIDRQTAALKKTGKNGKLKAALPLRTNRNTRHIQEQAEKDCQRQQDVGA